MRVRSGCCSLLGVVWLCCCASWSGGVAALESVTTIEEVDAIESSSKVYALLVLATQEPTADSGDEENNFAELAVTAYPALPELEQEMDGLATFAVVDIAPHRKGSLATKWNLPGLPALVVYTDPPKENPYTGKMYRDAMVADVAMLEHPRKLKRALKEGIPKIFVQELSEDAATLDGFGQFVDSHTQNDQGSVVVLISKQKHASPLFRALSAEFHDQGLTFAFVNKDESGVNELMGALKVEELPSLLVLRSMTEHVVLASESMKTYKELKGFVDPFAVHEQGRSADLKSKGGKKGKQNASVIKYITESELDDVVFASDVAWIVEFMTAEREAAASEEEWKKTFTGLHRKAGMVALGAVSCAREEALCERYGGPGVRVFPLALSGQGQLTRGDLLPQVFDTAEEAKAVAIESIPDVTVAVGSSTELNAFISRARESGALPMLLFTSKSTTPAMMKALVLSVPSQKLMLAVIHDADADIKAQFLLKPSVTTSLVCLVPTAPGASDPADSAPFGVVTYQKKTMGPYTYPNIMQFVLQVLSQYPHPQDGTPGEGERADYSSLDGVSSQSLVPYLTKTNMEDLCGGNTLCAIGFFEDHVDTLSDPESRLARSWATLAHVAALSKQNREPFQFMWINGKCQKNFAEAFGVGLYQMPTVAVYSPTKRRYATNVGIFDEENASEFLKSVLSGSIGTAPIGNVPDLEEECSFEEIQEVTMGASGEDGEDDEDLDDMLSEILREEKKQREVLEEQLKSDRKSGKKSRKGKKASKKGKSKKKKKAERDEL
ncbi:hypothetical protein BBJ28_00012070 [Nothophytophthora sp. Chile5]|nr:hypothetical protein BBJ28_00012070 [Nothophytophthora sp. Chile5]